MGGSAFNKQGLHGEPALETTRLSPDDYFRLRDEFMTILQRHYVHVASPPPAPSKDSHGDIDLIVCSPKHTLTHATIPLALNAVRTITTYGMLNLAVEFRPSDPHETPENHAAVSKPRHYTQVDVRTCVSPENLRWQTFQSSYGDLCSILGIALRPLGFTINDVGLYLRIRELEHTNKKAALVFLSNVPDTVMDFLELNVQKYKQGFKTELELFDWLAQSKYVRRESFEARREKAEDKRKERVRPMIKRFVDDYVPTLPLSDDDFDINASRTSALDEGGHYFGKQDEVATKLRIAKKEVGEATAMREIKKMLEPDGVLGDRANLVVRGVQRWVTTAKDWRLAVRDEEEMDEERQIVLGDLLDESGAALRSDVVAWLKGHWPDVREKEKQRIKEAKAARARDGG